MTKKISEIFFYEDGEIRAWTAPAVLLLVVFASYGLYFNHLGFFWDDWSFIWTHHFQGLDGLKAIFFTRPVRAFIEAPEYQVIGTNPSAWQLYSIFLRWVASISLWWFLRQLWKERSLTNFMIALLYSVYPGFSQQSIALTYHYMWLFQAVLFFSFGLMVRAIKVRTFFYIGMGFALILSGIQLFAIEYMFGTELLRPMFIWLALDSIVQTPRQRVRRTILYSLPFWAITLAYVYWRMFIFEFPYYQPTLLALIISNPILGLKGLFSLILDSFKITTIGAWENAVQVTINAWGTTRFSTIYPLLLIGSLLSLIFYQNSIKGLPETQSRSKTQQIFGLKLIIIGLLGFLLAGIPYYVSGLRVASSFEDDRLAISYLFSVSILLTGLINLIKDSKQGIVLAAVLASLALGTQFYNSALFRAEAESLTSFAWQLSWRIPALNKNAALLSDNLAFKFNDDEALTYLLNWMYDPQNSTRHFPYSVQLLQKRLGKEIPALEKGQEIKSNAYWVADFNGSTDNSIVIYYNPPSCLKIIDPQYDQGIVFAPVYAYSHNLAVIRDPQFLSPLAVQAMNLSNVGLIDPSPEHVARPPKEIFKDNPKTTWCYYFKKAELARQQGDWAQVASIASEANKGNFYPKDLSENLPFIEAYGRLGMWKEFETSFTSVSDSVPTLNTALCGILSRVKKSNGVSAEGNQVLLRLGRNIDCVLPAIVP